MPECQAEIRGLAKKAARARYHAATNIGDPEERKKEAAWAIASESRQKVEAGLYFAQAEPPIADKGDGWDADPWLLGCENGVVDLRTGTLRPGRPGDRITMTTGIIFDTSVKAPRWDRFLQEVFRCDAGLIGWVQRAAGYSASGDVREQVWFLKYGAGSNGKGAFDRATHAALGDYFANTPFSTIEINNRPSIPNDLAALVGRRFVTANESAETARLNESRVKALSGGDALTARFLNHEFFTFTPTLKLWASVNHLPRVTDLSYGFWRRVRLIPFTVQFAGQAIDKDLDRKLRAEGPGILAWIVRGAVAWAQKSLDPAPECVLAATETYRQESDPLGEFVAERCVVGAECRVGATAFYKEYTTWCDGRSIRERERLSSTAFGRRMAEKFEKDHGKSGTLYRGVGLQIGDGLTEKPVTSRSLPIQNPLRESDGENPSQPVTRHRGTDGRHDL